MNQLSARFVSALRPRRHVRPKVSRTSGDHRPGWWLGRETGQSVAADYFPRAALVLHEGTDDMNGYERRRFLASAIGAGALSVAAPWLRPHATASGQTRQRIKVGQIGIGHNHASAKLATFRKLADQYEVVGVVEPDAEWRKKRGHDPAYRDLPWMTEEQLLNTKDLAVVAVETDVCDLVPTAARCLDAGMHLHLDKPGGESLAPFKKLLDEAGRRGLTVQLGYMYRNNPAVQFCLCLFVKVGWAGLRSSRRDEQAAAAGLPAVAGAVSWRHHVHLRLPLDRPGGEHARQARSDHALPAPDAPRRTRVRQRAGRA